MKIEEALLHDWKVGEKIWEVYYLINQNVVKDCMMMPQPMGVIEVEVESVERKHGGNISWESVNVILKGDFGLDEDVSASENYNIYAMRDGSGWGEPSYSGKKFCIDKFFTKEEAEKKLKTAVRKWNNLIAECKENQRQKVKQLTETLEKESMRLKQVESEKEIDYNLLIHETRTNKED